MDERIRDLVSRMTREEKATILTGMNFWQTVPIERLGVPSVTMSDGPHGLRKSVNSPETGEPVTLPSPCFPTSAAMAATWNRELVREGARALGEITAAADVDVLLGPGVNIKRTPLCGRNFEYYSEDPYLAGELAARYVEGVQSAHVGTSLKHFAANNQEFDRLQVSSEVDERTLREIYLPAFEKAVKSARPWTVMCAYNRLNGVFCSEHRQLLWKILREEWGFEGIVVSDWYAVHDRGRALSASLELEMPYRDERSKLSLLESLESGKISERELDDAVGRLLAFILKAAESRGRRVKKTDEAANLKLLTDAAREAVTLLKNEDGVLPLEPAAGKKILVLGLAAEEPVIQGGGSSEVVHTGADSPLAALRELLEPGVKIEYQPLYRYARGMLLVDGLNRAVEAARRADTVVFFTADQKYAETEDRDRETMRLPASMERLIRTIGDANPNLVVVLQAGSAVEMTGWIDLAKAVVFTWFAGQGAGTAIAEVIAGTVNPSGKTAETFPLALEDTPAFGTYPGNGAVSPYSEGLLVGYRWYDTKQKDVLFPFGHGLSYTRFEYSDLEISTEGAPFPVRVRCSVTNAGDREGKETVQLYVRDPDAKVLRPFQELKGFEKITLRPGERKTVTFELDERAFSYYSVSFGRWHWETGTFEIRIGASSRDIRLTGSVYLENPADLT